MSLKTRVQVAIILLVVFVVVGSSAMMLRGVLDSRFQDALFLSQNYASQVEGFVLRLVNEKAPEFQPLPLTDEDYERVWTEIVRQDSGLGLLLQQLVGNSRGIVEIVVTDENDRVLAASLPSQAGQHKPPLPSFEEFVEKNLWRRLAQVFSSNQDFEVRGELGIGQEPIFAIRVIVSSVLLRNQLMSPIFDLAKVSVLSLLLSLALAYAVSRLAFGPLEQIADAIDRILRGEQSPPEAAAATHSKEFAAVESKLSLLGEQFRGIQAGASELRANIDQLLGRMEEAVLLFDRDNRLALAGSAAERLLGRGRWEAMGQTIDEILPQNTELGALVQTSVHLRRNVRDRAVSWTSPGGHPLRLLVSVETVEEFHSRERVGALVSLRDADPRRQIASQIDVSTRLASISRLTSGAAHEIKNPLNSITLHLEVLKAKLANNGGAAEEIEVISREIRRLDRVVKSFLDFTRPIELQIADLDLCLLLQEIASLVSPDAAQAGVQVVTGEMPEAASIRGDRDLLKQALLNVVVNGIQAMEQGGHLEIGLREEAEHWAVTVRDEGVGIPPKLQDKIYQLYFTTKGKGSGIGLAMTFRVMQLHGGTIDFTSEPGKGTEFRLQFPANGKLPARPEQDPEQMPGGAPHPA